MTAPDGKPRIRPVLNPSEDVQAILAKGLQYRGEPLNVPATMAHHPLLLKRFTLFAGLFLAGSSLPDRDRELLTLRAAWRSQAEYYFGHHVAMAEAAGVAPAEIKSVVDEAHPWPAPEATLMALADQLTSGTTVDDETWASLEAMYDEAQRLEAVLLVGFYRMLAGFVNTVGVEREPGVPGWM